MGIVYLNELTFLGESDAQTTFDVPQCNIGIFFK